MPREYDHTALALGYDGTYGSLEEHLVLVSWRKEAAQVLRTVIDLARQGGSSKGQALYLPYLSLGARLPIASDGWVSIDRDVGTGQVYNVDSVGPFAYARTASLDRGAIDDTLARWVDGPLSRFVVKFGVSEVAIERLRNLLGNGGLFAYTKKSVQLFPWGAPTSSQHNHYAITPGAVASMLAGHEIFPGLGKVVRVIGTRNNEAELMTRAVSAEGGLFSLVCKISLQTVPGADQPIIYLNFSRRRWATSLKHDFNATGVGGFVFDAVIRPELALRFDLERNFKTGWKTDDAFDELVNSLSLERDYVNEKVIHYPNTQDRQVLVVVHHAASAAEGSKLDAGVPLADQVDAFANITRLLTPVGLAPFRRYDPVAHKRFTVPRIEVLKTVARKTNPDSTPPVGAVTAMARKCGVTEDCGRQRIYLLVQDHNQVATIKSVIRQMMGDELICISMALPANVHGCVRSMPMAESKKDEDRIAARVTAWESFVREYDFGAQPMFLIQADEWYTYEGKIQHDDPVNKSTARRTLARLLGATVQYLLPQKAGADTSGKKEAEYHQRIQSAVLDLVYGHSGRILGLDGAIRHAFKSASLAPMTVVAVGSVSIYFNRTPSTVLVATRYDCPSSAPRVRLAHMLGDAVRTPWMAFGQALQYVASRGAFALPHRGLANSFFQQFLGEVLDDIALADPNAVVLIDAIRTRGMWGKLTDAQACFGAQCLDGHKSPPSAWGGLRIVRIRAQAPTMANVRLRVGTWADGSPLNVPTSVPTLFRVHGARAPTYWSYANPIGHHKRGRSCYRRMTLPKDRAGQITDEYMPDYGQHQNPRGTEFVVLQAGDEDDVDAIAVFCESLRLGVPQARGDVAVRQPSPLHAIEKLGEYMAL